MPRKKKVKKPSFDSAESKDSRNADKSVNFIEKNIHEAEIRGPKTEFMITPEAKTMIIEAKPEEKKEIPISESETGSKKERHYVRTAVILLILLIILDIVFLVYFLKPDLSFLKFNTGKVVEGVSTNLSKCEDGTLEGKCSGNKPFYCYNGELIKSAYNCGCPEGYKLKFQDCVKA